MTKITFALLVITEVKNKIDWDKREKMLKKLLSKYRRKSGYDVVVPSSGGKDSGMTAHILKYKYGMNPLTVTWSPHEFTSIGWHLEIVLMWEDLIIFYLRLMDAYIDY